MQLWERTALVRLWGLARGTVAGGRAIASLARGAGSITVWGLQIWRGGQAGQSVKGVASVRCHMVAVDLSLYGLVRRWSGQLNCPLSHVTASACHHSLLGSAVVVRRRLSFCHKDYADALPSSQWVRGLVIGQCCGLGEMTQASLQTVGPLTGLRQHSVVVMARGGWV